MNKRKQRKSRSRKEIVILKRVGKSSELRKNIPTWILDRQDGESYVEKEK